MIKSIFKRIGVIAFALVFGLNWIGSTTPASAEELQKVTIRVSADFSAPHMPTAVAMEWFKEKVEAEFPKGSKVRNFYAGALYKDPEAMVAMSDGNLEMGWMVAGKTAATDIWLGMIGQPGVLTTVGAIHDLGN